ncbi:Fur family transcriptional regulator [Cumulibacter manganitolerans]|uniref:Fur family transcriptional regulator n=1 Tax=Cumulibacter manganitolerans TaxID=1884992 RepID=UPI001295F5D5|nr:Fur family transcriptional regulator [Cumulibacter manganitolerans]
MSDALASQLRRRGMRLTAQRRQVLDAVRATRHATPEQIVEAVRSAGGSSSLTTVYRSLEVLEALGLVRHVHIGHGAPTYHPAEHYDHVHVRCNGCGRVESVSADLLAEVARALYDADGFRLDAGHVALAGLCAECADTKERTDGPTG